MPVMSRAWLPPPRAYFHKALKSSLAALSTSFTRNLDILPGTADPYYLMKQSHHSPVRQYFIIFHSGRGTGERRLAISKISYSVHHYHPQPQRLISASSNYTPSLYIFCHSMHPAYYLQPKILSARSVLLEPLTKISKLLFSPIAIPEGFPRCNL